MSGLQTERKLEILLVEDNPGDARLATEVWREARFPHRLSIVLNGEDALAFLKREGPHAGAPRPDLVLLDLNLPRKDGRELLTEIKADPSLRQIPIVVLTTSNAQQDIARSYDLHANCYIVKPIGLNQLVSVMTSIVEFWSRVVTLPR